MKPSNYGFVNYSKQHKRKKSAYCKLVEVDLGAEQVHQLYVCDSKYTFKNQLDALAAASRACENIGECRVYQCPYCGQWHISTNFDYVKEIDND